MLAGSATSLAFGGWALGREGGAVRKSGGETSSSSEFGATGPLLVALYFIIRVIMYY